MIIGDTDDSDRAHGPAGREGTEDEENIISISCENQPNFFNNASEESSEAMNPRAGPSSASGGGGGSGYEHPFHPSHQSTPPPHHHHHHPAAQPPPPQANYAHQANSGGSWLPAPPPLSQQIYTDGGALNSDGGHHYPSTSHAQWTNPCDYQRPGPTTTRPPMKKKEESDLVNDFTATGAPSSAGYQMNPCWNPLPVSSVGTQMGHHPGSHVDPSAPSGVGPGGSGVYPDITVIDSVGFDDFARFGHLNIYYPLY